MAEVNVTSMELPKGLRREIDERLSELLAHPSYDDYPSFTRESTSIGSLKDVCALLGQLTKRLSKWKPFSTRLSQRQAKPRSNQHQFELHQLPPFPRASNILDIFLNLNRRTFSGTENFEKLRRLSRSAPMDGAAYLAL